MKLKIKAIKVLSLFVFGFSVQAVAETAIYRPIPFAMLVMACITIIALLTSEATREYALIEKKERASMFFLIFWVLLSVYYTTITLTVLIFLSMFQQN